MDHWCADGNKILLWHKNKTTSECCREIVIMPAKSKKQQMAAGAALAAKRGEAKRSSLKGASKNMAKSMSKKQLEEIASTKRKKLPTRKGESKSKKRS
jgi:Protein of unknwon function (DUF3008)